MIRREEAQLEFGAGGGVDLGPHKIDECLHN
jgi:hypothetical protein